MKRIFWAVAAVLFLPISIPYKVAELLEGNASQRNIAAWLLVADFAIGIVLNRAGCAGISTFLFLVICMLIGAFASEVVNALKEAKGDTT